MKAFAAHVKAFSIVYDERRNKRTPKTKWVKVVMQVPTAVHRVALSVASGLSEHMRQGQPRWLTVVDPDGPEMAVVRVVAALVAVIDANEPSRVKGPKADDLLVKLYIAARELPKGEPVIR